MSVILLAFAIGIDILFVQYLRDEFDRALLARVQSVSTLLEQDEDGVDFDFSPEVMPEFSAVSSAEYFELWLAEWPRSRRAAALGGKHLPRFADRATEPRFRDFILPDGRVGRAVQLDFLARLDPKEHLDPARIKRPAASLVVARSRTQLEGLVRSLRVGLALLVTMSIGLAHYLVRRTVSRGMRPLAIIRAELATMQATALHERLSLPDNAAELAPLIEQFNVLFDDLERAFHRQQEFSAAAAHELRTPLAEIRSLAEIGGRIVDDRVLASEYFSDITAAATQMESLARNLLVLARHDTGLVSAANLEDFDLVAAVTQAWRAEAETASARNLRFKHLGPAAVGVRTERKIVDLLLRNVISNAVAYSPLESEVSVECRVDADRVAVVVANPRGDLQENDLTHIFERFWRKDAARHEDGHTGLGLAIVRTYAEQLGVQSIAMLDEQGRFVLQLEGFRASSANP